MSEQHFVYVYRDLHGNPVYFGQGFGAARPADHLGGSHNPEFAEWLRQNVGRYRLQVMGPLGSKQMADAVETALISACKPASRLELMNVQPGVGKFMFRSYGVPEGLSSRISEPLGREELAGVVRQFGPIMFVKVHQGDHELRFDPAQLPEDSVICARIRGWWQVGRYRQQWINRKAQSPGLLLGVTGVGGSQIVIAAAKIDVDGWADSPRIDGNLYEVPLSIQGDLDAAGLRGRPIRSDFQLKFDRARYGHFRIFGPDGFVHEADAAPRDE
jgi:hypothetical protein